jgi:membrane-bound serine protease (ClpP class)
MLCAATGLLMSTHVRAASRHADILSVEVINDLTARTLDAALSDRPTVVVLDINSLGGTEPALDHMLSAIASSRIPVIAYIGNEEVAQDAAWILAESTDLIGVSPTATLGAPRPIGFSQPIQGFSDPGALASALAIRHDRDGTWPDTAVSQGALVSGSDAIVRHVANYQASSVNSFLHAAINGSSITIDQISPTGWDGVVNSLAGPDTAYLLMVLTLVLLALWYARPQMVVMLAGAFAAGIASAFAFSQLPINMIGVVLTTLATVFFVLDIVTSGYGMFTAAGAVVMVLGGWQLVDTGTMAGGVDLALIALVVAATVTVYRFSIPRLLALRRQSHADPSTQLIGQTATVTEALRPEGMVSLSGTLWQASATRGALEVGREVKVVNVEGLRLTVR